MVSYLLPYDFSGYTNAKGFRIALEEKFYLKKTANFDPYLGLELDYINSITREILNFNHPNSAMYASNYSDEIGVYKRNISLYLKYGYQFIIKRFAIDVYAGLGIRFKNVQHLDKINPDDKIVRSRHQIFGNFNREGIYEALSFPLNVRIGWMF